MGRADLGKISKKPLQFCNGFLRLIFNNEIAFFFDREEFKIFILHRNPGGEESLCHCRGISFEDAIFSFFLVNIQKNGKVIIAVKGRMSGICALENCQLFRCHGDRREKRHCLTVKGTKCYVVIVSEGDKYFRNESLAIKISTHLGKALFCPLLRSEKIIVKVKYGAVLVYFS